MNDTDLGGEEQEIAVCDISRLVALREGVEDWVRRASEALEDFSLERDDGSYWKDSRTPETDGPQSPPNITTTARSYVALAAADAIKDGKDRRDPPSWSSKFELFTSTPKVFRWGRHLFELGKKVSTGLQDKQNDFDVAHLSDFLYVCEYLNRFYPLPDDQRGLKLSGLKDEAEPSEADLTAIQKHKNKAAARKSLSPDPKLFVSVLNRLSDSLEESLGDSDSRSFLGEVRFEKGRPESAHFFATLHVMRALHALKIAYPKEVEAAITPEKIKAILQAARTLAVEQCFYFQRGITSKQDPLRLAFAACLYAVYEENIDKDFCLAVVEALAQAQQSDGSWPATHPVIRKGRVPWHISSHEVALCLTWMYFQPRVPDSARPLLLRMMERYFTKGVIVTYHAAGSQSGHLPSIQPIQAASPQSGVRDWRGWQDDHTRSEGVTVGWATAVVCHFLSNFALVLDDWINRRVIEDLGLGLTTPHYIIDEIAKESSRRWQHEVPSASADGGRRRHLPANAIWPDLPPHAWLRKAPSEDALASLISDGWTDPSDDRKISQQLASYVLHPIFSTPNEQPLRDMCAGILPGDPGTRKTSLVKQIAKTLRWPMIAVPASLIFERGFGMMEAQGTHVFWRLNQLRRCVVFFDEFEEFFLSRDIGSVRRIHKRAADELEQEFPDPNLKGAGIADPGIPYESRTIAAFTTSAMLPRLQDLHDAGRCLIFAATNWYDKIDPAIRRVGRFDFQVKVPYPKLERLAIYVDKIPDKAREDLGLDKMRTGVEHALTGATSQRLRKLAEGDPCRVGKFGAVEGMLRSIASAEARWKRASDDSADEEMRAAEVRKLVEERLEDLLGKADTMDPPELTTYEPPLPRL
ncbi:MAG: hypothetical protein QOH04_2907 [Sphingomonadales bacterium]|jgi:hypothetical protein|nr:hypothetical protein [Sphingomonadales bacterium]